MLLQSTLCDLEINSDNRLVELCNEPEPECSIFLETIIPLIKEEWNDEEYAYGELYDKIYSKLSTDAASLRRQLQKCTDPCQYQQIEKELAEVEVELCTISLKFDELTEYPL